VSLDLTGGEDLVGKSKVNGVTLNFHRCPNSIDPNIRPLVCRNDSVETNTSQMKIGSIFDNQIIITEDFSGEMTPNEELITITVFKFSITILFLVLPSFIFYFTFSVMNTLKSHK